MIGVFSSLFFGACAVGKPQTTRELLIFIDVNTFQINVPMLKCTFLRFFHAYTVGKIQVKKNNNNNKHWVLERSTQLM